MKNTDKLTHTAVRNAEPKEVSKLLKAMDDLNGTPAVKAALLISPLLFQRPGEIRQMHWADIDFEKNEWRYRVTKTDTLHIIPLSKQALKILEEIRPITQHSKYVFPSARGLICLSTITKHMVL